MEPLRHLLPLSPRCCVGNYFACLVTKMVGTEWVHGGIILVEEEANQGIHILLIVLDKNLKLGGVTVRYLQELGRTIRLESLQPPLFFWRRMKFEFKNGYQRTRWAALRDRGFTNKPVPLEGTNDVYYPVLAEEDWNALTKPDKSHRPEADQIQMIWKRVPDVEFEEP